MHSIRMFILYYIMSFPYKNVLRNKFSSGLHNRIQGKKKQKVSNKVQTHFKLLCNETQFKLRKYSK